MTSRDDTTLARRIDWRFLLHDPHPRAVVVVDPTDAERLAEAFRLLGPPATIVVATGGDTVVGPDVVFARDPSRAHTAELVGASSTVGTIVVETTSRRTRLRIARRLRRADLGTTHYGCWPSVAEPTRFVPLRDRRAVVAVSMSAKNPRRRAIGSALARLGVGSVVFREAVTLAAPPTRDTRPAPHRVAFEHGRAGATVLLTPRFGSSRHVIAMCDDGDGHHLVVKTPRVPGDDAQIERESRGASVVVGPEPPRPAVVADRECCGQRWLVQTFVDGAPLTRRDVGADPERWLGAAQRWLGAMPVGAPATPDADGRFDRLLRPALAVLAAATEREPALAPLLADAHAATSRLRRTALPVVAEHGDFRPPNLIVDASGSLVAVDWELADPAGLPMHDLALFHSYVTDIVPDVAPAARRAGVDVIGELGLAPQLLEPLRTVALLRHLANAVQRGTGTATTPSPVLANSDVARAWFALLADRRRPGSGSACD